MTSWKLHAWVYHLSHHREVSHRRVLSRSLTRRITLYVSLLSPWPVTNAKTNIVIFLWWYSQIMFKVHYRLRKSRCYRPCGNPAVCKQPRLFANCLKPEPVCKRPRQHARPTHFAPLLALAASISFDFFFASGAARTVYNGHHYKSMVHLVIFLRYLLKMQ